MVVLDEDITSGKLVAKPYNYVCSKTLSQSYTLQTKLILEIFDNFIMIMVANVSIMEII